MKKQYIVSILIFLSSYCFSQEYSYVGIRVGGGISTLKGLQGYKELPIESENNLSVGNRFSWDLGFAFQEGLKNDVFYQVETLIGVMGASLDGAYRNSGIKINSVNLSSMQLSAYLGKKKALSNQLKLFVAVGAYIDWDFGSSFFYDEGNESILISYDTNFRQWDLGMVALAGIEYRNIQFAFNPRFGLIDISPNGSGIHHRGYKFAITYYL